MFAVKKFHFYFHFFSSAQLKADQHSSMMPSARAKFEADFKLQKKFWKQLSKTANDSEFTIRVEEHLKGNKVMMEKKRKLPKEFETMFKKEKSFWSDANNSLNEEEFSAMIEDGLAKEKLAVEKLELAKYKKPKVADKFQCATCNLVFNKKDTLKTHFLVHSKSKDALEWGCNFCKKCFKSAARLKLHMDLVHTVTAPIQCRVCGKTFCKVASSPHCRIKIPS